MTISTKVEGHKKGWFFLFCALQAMCGAVAMFLKVCYEWVLIAGMQRAEPLLLK
jgi:hypothetical protein